MLISDLENPLAAILAAGTPAPSPTPTDAADEAAQVTIDLAQVIGSAAAGIVVGFVVGVVVVALIRYIFRRKRITRAAVHPVTKPIEFTLTVLGMLIAVNLLYRAYKSEPPRFVTVFQHISLILLILGITWVVTGMASGFFDALLLRTESQEPSRLRRVQTQVQILRRVVAVVIVVLGIAAALLTFPNLRAAGASIFASAGLLSVVAGIAAQSWLGNVFAGLQLAFSDSIRVDDVVLWEDNFTYVEEITLTYVVLSVWDGRRLIVPSSQLTTKTFENWTRKNPEMIGVVQLEVAWNAPFEEMRNELQRLLDSSEWWDGRSGSLAVKEATADRVIVEMYISAENPSALTDLKNFVRESMVVWLREQAPTAIPHRRFVEFQGEPELWEVVPKIEAPEESEAGSDQSASGAPEASSGADERGKLRDEAAGSGSATGNAGKDAPRSDPGVSAAGNRVTVSSGDLAKTVVLSKDAIRAYANGLPSATNAPKKNGPKRVSVKERLAEEDIPEMDPTTSARKSAWFTTSEMGRPFAGPSKEVQRERTRAYLLRTGQVDSEQSPEKIDRDVDEIIAREEAERRLAAADRQRVTATETENGTAATRPVAATKPVAAPQQAVRGAKGSGADSSTSDAAAQAGTEQAKGGARSRERSEMPRDASGHPKLPKGTGN